MLFVPTGSEVASRYYVGLVQSHVLVKQSITKPFVDFAFFLQPDTALLWGKANFHFKSLQRVIQDARECASQIEVFSKPFIFLLRERNAMLATTSLFAEESWVEFAIKKKNHETKVFNSREDATLVTLTDLRQ